MRILANDGLSQMGKSKLEEAGFDVSETKVAQEQLANYINQNQIDVLLVRSATQVDKKIIENWTGPDRTGRVGRNVMGWDEMGLGGM